MVKVKLFVAMLGLAYTLLFSCGQKNDEAGDAGIVVKDSTLVDISGQAVPAAERTAAYFYLVKNKKIAVLVNQTSLVGRTHLIDTLVRSGVHIVKIFAPEHGYRGRAADGETVSDEVDPATGIPVVSLYGKKKQPALEDLAGVDLVLFDVQDVGARFYTYISTLTYLMEACAAAGKPLLLLDRPNPNGHYVDGPVLEPAQQSFVGLHPVPVVHGLTIGEYARMVNGEGWLSGGRKCALEVIPCAGYDHTVRYDLPVQPSPNLPNMRAIYLYPSLCFFEGTVVSVGRGTERQFQVFGAPGATVGDYTFTPQPNEGSKSPPQAGKLCRGYDLSAVPVDSLRGQSALNLRYLLDFYHQYPDQADFFLKTLYFDKLAGNVTLRGQIIAGAGEAEIRRVWQPGLAQFKAMRKQYLLYPDFE